MGLLQLLDVPEWKCDSVSMDFMVGLPWIKRKNNMIWVVVDRLTKTTHFIALRNTWTLDQLALSYLKKIVRLHGVPSSMASDRDTRFQLGFWQKLHESFGTSLHFSTKFHPTMDEQTEQTIQTEGDMLQACTLDFNKVCDEQLVLIEFSYNNSYYSSIGMTPYEALYGRKSRTSSTSRTSMSHLLLDSI